MYLTLSNPSQLIIATCLVLTANGYSFQRPIRPSIVTFQAASSHPHPNSGIYGGQHSVAAGTRNHPTFKQQPVGPPPAGVRPYISTPSHIAAPSSVSQAHRPLAVRPNTYPIRQQQQRPQGVQPNRPPYPPQINVVAKTALPKHPEIGKVVTSQAYPVGPPASSNHVPSVHGSPTGPVRAEASHQVKTKNPQPQGWIPSYGAQQNPSQQSGSQPVSGGYLQQPSKPSGSGQGSNIKKKKEKESTNESFSPNRETPLQTAYTTTRKPISQETKAKPNRKNPGEVPSIIPQTISHSNALPAANNYQIHKNPTASEVKVPSKPNALVPASEAHNYQQIPKSSIHPNTSSQSEPRNTPSSVAVNSYQETKTSLAPAGKGGKYPAQSHHATNTNHQIPKPSTPSAVSSPQTASPQSTTSTERYQPPHQVKVTTETIVPQQYESVKENKESHSDESKETHYKTPPSEAKSTTDPAGDDREIFQLSTYTADVEPNEHHSGEQTSPKEVTYGGASSERDVQNAVATTTTKPADYPTQQPIEMPSTNPLIVPTTTSFSLPSFDGSAIPKYVLGTYSPLVLPEPPLELAHSAYGLSQLAIEEPHDATAQQTISPQSTGSYGAPVVSLDNIKSLPLSQQWGYYSAEPFQPASVEISQSDIFSGALGGGYHSPQALATGAQVNNPAPGYGFEQSDTSQQNSGYSISQKTSAGSENPYQISKQTANAAATQNTFDNNQRILSTDANIGGRHQQYFGNDKPLVAGTLGSENVLNDDGSFSYK